MKNFTAFMIGLLFSAGLIVSGMINPAKVLGFLDLFGQWNASLAFVMGGAVLVTTIGFRLVWSQQTGPLFSNTFSIPKRSDIDAPLIIGPVLFGAGWGLVGLCPGPAFAAIVASPKSTWLFFIAMVAGMLLGRRRGEFTNWREIIFNKAT